jgi:hypothetical protein
LRIHQSSQKRPVVVDGFSAVNILSHLRGSEARLTHIER